MPRKNVVSITDSPDITSAVYCGCKAKIKQTKAMEPQKNLALKNDQGTQNLSIVFPIMLHVLLCSFFAVFCSSYYICVRDSCFVVFWLDEYCDSFSDFFFQQ